jgi:hypothetical protein
MVPQVSVLPHVRPPVMVVVLATDHRHRLLMVHDPTADLWRLPHGRLAGDTSPEVVATTAARAAGAAGPGPPRLLGVSWAANPPELQLAYQVAVAGTGSGPGLLLPPDLLPLNSDPRDMAATDWLRGQRPEMGDLPDSAHHLQVLRNGQTEATEAPLVAEPLIAAVSGRLQSAQGAARAPLLARLGELWLMAGAVDRGRACLEAAISCDGNRAVTIWCSIRLASLDGLDAGDQVSWQWVSKLTAPGRLGGDHLDVVFAQLGFSAARRRRRREAEVYLRRALQRCDAPHRRAALRHGLAWRGATPARVSA